MNLPMEAFIFSATLLGAAGGYLVCAFFTRVRRGRIEKDAWNQARLFYTRRYEEQGRRI